MLCNYRQWMKIYCKQSCKQCSPPCYDQHDNCARWASEGECEKNPGTVH